LWTPRPPMSKTAPGTIDRPVCRDIQLVASQGDLTCQLDLNTPGTIGGPNNSIVTINGSGLATVRLALTGSPADFVRAQTIP